MHKSHPRGSLTLHKARLGDNFDSTRGLICPVSDQEYLSLVEEIFSVALEIILSQKDTEFDVLIGDYRFLISITQHLHMKALHQACGRRRLELVIDESQKKVLRPDWNKVGSEFQRTVGNGPRGRQWASVVLANLKSVSAFVGSSTGWPFGFPNALAIGKADWMRSEYALKNSKRWIQSEPWLSLTDVRGISSAADKYKIYFIGPFFDRIADNVRELFDPADFTEVFENWAKRLADAEAIYLHFLRKPKRFRSLLVNGGTNPLRKLMLLAYQRSGVSTAVFHHGNDFGGRVQKYGHIGEVSHCKNFICPTNSIARNYRRAYGDLSIEQRSGIRYLSTDSKYFANIYAACQVTNPGKYTQRAPIMLVGRPINNGRLLDASGAFLLHKVQLERDLLKTLDAGGEKVIYKAHPDTAIFAQSLFASLCQVLVEPIEKVYSEAKCLVFTTATSTAFGFALSTTIPIVLVEHDENLWQKGVEDKVGRRCALVRYSTSSTGIAVISPDEIYSAIHKAYEKSSDETFVNTVMV